MKVLIGLKNGSLRRTWQFCGSLIMVALRVDHIARVEDQYHVYPSVVA